MSEPPARAVKRQRWVPLLAVIIAAVAGVWLLGLGWFLALASRDVPAAPHADAIVVLTGGPDRVEVALRLLDGGAANRLLVSGAGEKTELPALARLSEIDLVPLEQQVTLGHAARSTHGNALETAAWAREQGIETLLVVTSWFHMPRALIELRRAMPGVALQPYPVGRPVAEDLIREGEARRVIGEYHKYLAALAGLTASPVVVAAWSAHSAK